MAFVNQMLWLLPFAIHTGYGAAVFSHFPATVGRTVESAGVPVIRFYLLWFLIVAAANAAFVVLHRAMPGFGDRMLSVPNKAYWLDSPERREALIRRLRGVVEAALLGLNLFFLAVFQTIYQVNVQAPLISFPRAMLFAGFMVAPLLAVAIHFGATVHWLRRPEPPSGSA